MTGRVTDRATGGGAGGGGGVPDLVVVETGSANLASVLAAFARLGATPLTTRDPADVRAARRVVLPGVGAFGDVVARLAETGLGDAVRERAASGAPLLAVCLGLQVLAESSEESPGARGLGVITGAVRRFPASVKVPQLGWNRVSVTSAQLLGDGYAFFANSYALDAAPDAAPDGWTAAWAVHGMPFVAAIERGPQLACQFHPELSGAWGAALLDRWYRSC
ncbi:MAG: imidazole glycerol phosphate synthase subunit HisH [Gemmatimonadota bacterium]|nr:imidazole glycerol phosphate synthase subunit HisH [Gemmatimonadota bacterium]